MRRLATASLTAVMIAHHITPADCFSAVQSTKVVSNSQSSSNRRGVSYEAALYYANTHEPSAAFYHDASFTNAILGTSNSRRQLPTWLAIDRTPLYEQNIQKLTQVLRDSLFSDDAIQTLLQKIAESAGSDRNMAAGAAEFCLILAETMEMGLSALTAAVEHFCHCVRSRERGAYDASSAKDTIVADAARLKQLEMVANAVKQDNERASVKDAENLRHLLLTETKDWRALAIRCAASLFRLRGIESSGHTSPLTKEAVRTSREAFHIYAPLASRLGMHRLKNELEGAAFRILYPRQYKAVHQQQDDTTSDSMRQILETVQSKMTDLLQHDAEFQKNIESFHVSARVKEPYSLWRKMLAQGYKHVLEVPDALALRIVLTAKPLTQGEPIEVTEAREKALCYYAQQLCTKSWKPVASDPRFKDYIKNPKSNGYQSLHYTAQVDKASTRTLEVQVRTAAMHHTAEFGPRCNHWGYKASLGERKSKQALSILPMASDNDNSDSSVSAYLRNVQQWHWKQHGNQSVEDVESSYEPMNRERAARIRARTEQLQPYLQAVKNAQSDLTLESVFVFLSSREGQVLALPAGACVLDALRAATKEPGVVARINGQDCAITRRLHNGDVLQLSRATVTL